MLTEVGNSAVEMEVVEVDEVALFTFGEEIEDVKDGVLEVDSAVEEDGGIDDGEAGTGELVSGGRKGVTDGFDESALILKYLEVELFPEPGSSASLNEKKKTLPYWKSCVI